MATRAADPSTCDIYDSSLTLSREATVAHAEREIGSHADFIALLFRLLLKYSTRDEVELLKKGKAGVSELREAIATYTEESPLYGFLRFRRKSVLLKYVPEGTSRLLQGKIIRLYGLSQLRGADGTDSVIIYSTGHCTLSDNPREAFSSRYGVSHNSIHGS